MTKKQKIQKKLKKEGILMQISGYKGITVIALIITIIVLLILAGVVLATITGEDGVIQKAIHAKEEQERAEKEEQSDLNEISNMINYYTKNTTINGEEGTSYNPTIPEGFKPVNTETANWGDGTTAPTKEAVEAGLVIEDEEGNQFVWVPCTTEGEEGLISYAQDKSYNDGTKATKQYEYAYSSTDSLVKYTDWRDEGNIESVKVYGGFYIARYEAGVPENADFYASEENGYSYSTNKNHAEKDGVTYKPVSKAGAQSWNYISQENAKIVAQNMYAGSSSVKSQLVDSFAWDTIMNWMERDNAGIATDSKDYGNYLDGAISGTGLSAIWKYDYSTSTYTLRPTTYSNGNYEIGARTSTGEVEWLEIGTGTSEKTKVKNIYDMAGNMWEWTTETGKHNNSGTKYAVFRGGSFRHHGSSDPLSYRYGNSRTANTSYYIGFRVVLYL